MKVLMITDRLIINGISTVVMNYSRNINFDDLQIDIFTGNPVYDPFVNELNRLGCTVYIQKERSKYPFEYYKKLINVIFHNNYDAIHVHTNSCTCIIELLIAKVLGVKKRIAHCHSSNCEHMLFHKVMYPLLSLLYTDALACSYEAGKHLFRDKPFIVLNNGINVEKFAYDPNKRNKLRDLLGIHDDIFVIGHVGLFNETKNHTFLIDVLYEYLKNNPNTLLVLIGKGITQNKIKEKVESLAIEKNVLFLGEKSNACDYYNIFDCFCFPSLYEGLGITMIEAQANGLPCLASSGVPNTTKFGNQVQYLNLDIMTWVTALKELKQNNRKNDSRMNCEALSSAHYDIHSNADKLKRIYMRD